MEMKKENDIMRYNLQFAMNGGDLQKMDGKEKLKAFLDMTPDQPDSFKTPQINNDFEQDSEFQVASAAVKSFGEESGELRKPVDLSEVKSIIQLTKEKQSPLKEIDQSPVEFAIAKAMISEKLSQRSSAKKSLKEEEVFDKNSSARSMIMEKLVSLTSARVESVPEEFEAGNEFFEPSPLKNLQERSRKQLGLSSELEDKYIPKIRGGAPKHYVQKSKDISDPVVYADYMQACLERRATASYAQK
jgi:hypothetical protein